jgi:hypothetical protein
MVDTNPARSPANRTDWRNPAADEEANHQKAPSMYRSPGNLGPPITGPLKYAFTMAIITADAIGESGPSNTPGTSHFEARNARKAPTKPMTMSSL